MEVSRLPQGNRAAAVRRFVVVVRFVAFLRQSCVKCKAAASCSRVYPAAFVRQTQGLISCSKYHLVRIRTSTVRSSRGCLATSKHRPKNARKMNMLKILRTMLRQPCGLAKRKMVLRLPQEKPKKCVRRQVHGCRRADVKRALIICAFILPKQK